MDYSFLGDLNAIAEILATAEPEHRSIQSARSWDDKTLALHIATDRHLESVLRDEKAHAQEEEEWKERVLRMSDEDLEMEDDVIRAKVEAYGLAEYRAMSGEERRKTAPVIINKLKWSKVRLAFTKQERESRGAKWYSERLQCMSNAELNEEMIAITAQLNDNTAEIDELPIVHEPRVSEGIRGQARLLKAKHTGLIQEHKRRAPKLKWAKYAYVYASIYSRESIK